MTDLILDSLEIRNFRAFRHLRIEKLGRVNLITGKNNVGKTCLLEALWLYARRGDPSVVWEMLGGRDERSNRFVSDIGDHNPITTEERVEAVKYLFHGRNDIRRPVDPINIGSGNDPSKALFIAIGWQRQAPSTDSTESSEIVVDPRNAKPGEILAPSMFLAFGGEPFNVQPLNFDFKQPPLLKPHVSEETCIYISMRGMAKTQVGELWDNVALTAREEDVLASLRIISPTLDRLSFVADKGFGATRSPRVKLRDVHAPVPLRNLGEGLYRLLSMSLAMVNAQDGFLLVDEIDTGLHYSVLAEVWRLIFEIAERLKVQVFATTHSWDCIQAFQQAADKEAEDKALLIRLENDDGYVSATGDIAATLFDERKLAIATREHIEVR